MEIKNLIKCQNDNIIPIQSKMIANMLLSGTPYQRFQYKDVSDNIYKKYHTYIRFHKCFDKNIKIRDNVAEKDVGHYAGEVSWLCVELGLPLISVMIIDRENDMPNNGFFVFPQCEEMRKQGIKDREIVRQIREQVADAIEKGKYKRLIDYLNRSSNINISALENTKVDNITQVSHTDSASNTTKNEEQEKQPNFNETEFYEGMNSERTFLIKKRNQTITKLAKQRDNYTCKVCGFSYKEKVVEEHHLVPMANINEEYEIKIENLITLCPTCHALAHLLLKENEIYTDKIELIKDLKRIRSFK